MRGCLAVYGDRIGRERGEEGRRVCSAAVDEATMAVGRGQSRFARVLYAMRLEFRASVPQAWGNIPGAKASALRWMW